MTLRFLEIAEAHHRIQNPLNDEQLLHIGKLCDLNRDSRVLDLACGKGELLCRWSQEFDVIGVGVDASAAFIDAARRRAFELEIWMKLTWVHDSAADFPAEFHRFDLVSCLNGTGLGGGLTGTLDLMRLALNRGMGTLVIGDWFWLEPPPDDALAAFDLTPDALATLDETAARFRTAGVDVQDVVVATHKGWDDYVTKQWQTVYKWLDTHPADPDAPALQTWVDQQRTVYQAYGRRYVGFAAFILRAF